MQIDVKGIENMFMVMVLNLFFSKHKNPKRLPFLFFLTWKLTKHIPIWNYHPKGQFNHHRYN